MKTSNMTYRIALCLFAVLITNQLHSQQYAERMLYRDSYAAQQIKSLQVINKHGSIHIKNWDKDSIQISTDVYLSAQSTKRLNKLKNSIHIKYDQIGNNLIAQTLFGDNKLLILSDLQGFGNSISTSIPKNIEINYEIFLPSGIDIKITSQFGDISLGKLDNKLNIDLANGSFKAYNLTQNAKFTFSFVNAMLNDAKEIAFDIKYSTINMNKAVNLDFESRSSELFIETVGVLKLKSYRDKININELDYVYGNSNYSNIRVDKLVREIDGYFTYGQITVDKVLTSATLINLNSERTDIKLYVPRSVNFKYDIMYNIDAILRLPEKNIKNINASEADEIQTIQGKYGSDPTLDIRIRALKRCAIQIMKIAE